MSDSRLLVIMIRMRIRVFHDQDARDMLVGAVGSRQWSSISDAVIRWNREQ